MKKFEIGKRYKDISESGLPVEIINRTAKTITFVTISHEGKINEKASEPKKSRISIWDKGEVFCTRFYTVASF
jgi:hypothetical protein